MADVLGVDIKKVIEFLLSLIAMILFIVAGVTDGIVFVLVVLTFCYLCMIVTMTIINRGIGASTPLEAVFGVFSLAWGISHLSSNGFKSPTELGIAAALNIILGLMFIIIMLF